MEEYTTLSFKSLKSAKKNLNEIESYFNSLFVKGEILHGLDERGNKGYSIKYIININSL